MFSYLFIAYSFADIVISTIFSPDAVVPAFDFMDGPKDAAYLDLITLAAGYSARAVSLKSPQSTLPVGNYRPPPSVDCYR